MGRAPGAANALQASHPERMSSTDERIDSGTPALCSKRLRLVALI